MGRLHSVPDCGLGLIQITGREEYAAFAASIGMSIDDAAAYAATPSGAAASAAWFWIWKKINPSADAWDLPHMTLQINGGETDLDDRVTACNAALAALSIIFATSDRRRDLVRGAALLIGNWQ